MMNGKDYINSYQELLLSEYIKIRIRGAIAIPKKINSHKPDKKIIQNVATSTNTFT